MDFVTSLRKKLIEGIEKVDTLDISKEEYAITVSNILQTSAIIADLEAKIALAVSQDNETENETEEMKDVSN